MGKFALLLLAMVLISVSACAEAPKSVSAKDFGAVGDGVADDTAAIQKALDAASSGGVVHLPVGKYKLSGSLKVPHGVTLIGEVVRWENASVQLIVPEPGFPAVRMGHAASVKGLAIVYPNNQDNADPKPYPPAIQLEGINPSVENINFSGAWIGVSTAPGGCNSGQGMFRELTGFVHHVGIHLSGCRDVNRIQDVHWFVGGNNTPGKEAYYVKNRVGFQFGDVDGVMMDRCFMILGKTFFHQLPVKDTPDGSKTPAHSLGFQIDECWIEHVQNGFIFEGATGFVLNNSNILVDKGGVGVRVRTNGLFYNAVISGVQVRDHNGAVVGFEYDCLNPHPRNRLAISDCQVTGGAPSVHLKKGAQRAQIHDCHLSGANGKPAILIDRGADLFTITNNILSGEKGIQDNSAPSARKTVSGNLAEKPEKP